MIFCEAELFILLKRIIHDGIEVLFILTQIDIEVNKWSIQSSMQVCARKTYRHLLS